MNGAAPGPLEVPGVGYFATDEVMAAFRRACRPRGRMERQELLCKVACSLGFQGVDRNAEAALEAHLAEAVRRRIVGADGHLVYCQTRRTKDYTRDELIGFIRTLTRPGGEYDRDEIIVTTAHYLGFARVRDEVVATVNSAINTAVRRGVLARQAGRLVRNP